MKVGGWVLERRGFRGRTGLGREDEPDLVGAALAWHGLEPHAD